MAASPDKLKFDLIGIPLFVLVVAIVVLLNLVSLRVFTRIDLTENQIYTLADGTKRVLAGLDDIVKIEFYRTRNLPARLASTVKGIEDYLAEYKAFGGRYIQVSFIDPDDSPDTVQQMRILGIPELQFNVIEADRQEVRKGYLGMGIFYADRKEVIQAVAQLEDFEYRLTSAIVKVTQDTVPVIGMWFGDTDPSVATKKPEMRYEYDKEFETVRRALQQQYRVEPVSFEQGKLVADHVSTLIVASPLRATERDLYALDQFLMRGGNLVVLQEVNQRSSDMSRAEMAPTPVTSLLAHYGVRINNDLVADERNQRAMFQLYGRRVLRGYPLWPRITAESFLKDDIATRGLNEIVMFWTSSVSVDRQSGDTYIRPLVQSSRRSLTLTLPTLLTPDQPEFLRFPEQEPQSLVVAVEGPFTSYFQGREKPAPLRLRGDLPPEPAPESPLALQAQRLDSTDRGRLVVAGSAYWLTSEALQMAPQNLGLLLNIIDSLEIGDKLMGVRMRDAGRRLITRELTEAQRSWLKFIGTFGAAMLVIFWAGIRMALRWRERKEFAEAMGYVKPDHAG